MYLLFCLVLVLVYFHGCCARWFGHNFSQMSLHSGILFYKCVVPCAVFLPSGQHSKQKKFNLSKHSRGTSCQMHSLKKENFSVSAKIKMERSFTFIRKQRNWNLFELDLLLQYSFYRYSTWCLIFCFPTSSCELGGKHPTRAQQYPPIPDGSDYRRTIF